MSLAARSAKSEGEILPPRISIMPAVKPLFLTAAAVAFGLTASLVPTKARADVDWTLDGVTFNDGGTASGTFVTSDTGQIQSWDITTTAGGALGAETYDSADGSTLQGQRPGTFTLGSDDLTTDLLLIAEGQGAEPFTAANNPVTLRTGSLETLQSNGDQRALTAGEAVIDAPEPVSIALLGTGLAGILITRRRRV
jgi:hypothetical protein